MDPRTDPNRKYSRDLPQRGLEIPCVLTVRGTKDLVDKAVKLLAISIFRKKCFRNLRTCHYENYENFILRKFGAIRYVLLKIDTLQPAGNNDTCAIQ